MTPDENDLRRALEARSGAPTPEFRSRLSTRLHSGRPARDGVPALAVAAAVLLVAGSIGVFIAARAAQRPPATAGPRTVVASPSPSPEPSVAPSVTPTVSPAPVVSPSAPITLPTTADLSAPSAAVIWAFIADSALFRSTDSGITWQQRSLPASDQVREIAFADERSGWVLAPGAQAMPCQSAPVSIWATADGGSTWRTLTPTGIAAGQCKSGLSFTDVSHGYLGAWGPSSAPVIYRTADGGNTWAASAPLPDPPGFSSAQAGGQLTPGRVHAFGSTLLVDATSPARGDYVFRSNDGGATWVYASTAPPAGGALGLMTASHWLELAGPGQSQETTDGGSSWHGSATDYTQAAPVAPEVTFGDSQVGYATVRGSIQRTTDGGAHWTAIKTPGT